METGTLPQEAVREHLSKYFVPLKFQSGRDADQFLRFDVRATPTYVILDEKGNELKRFIGYQSAEDFIRLLEQ